MYLDIRNIPFQKYQVQFRLWTFIVRYSLSHSLSFSLLFPSLFPPLSLPFHSFFTPFSLLFHSFFFSPFSPWYFFPFFCNSWFLPTHYVPYLVVYITDNAGSRRYECNPGTKLRSSYWLASCWSFIFVRFYKYQNERQNHSFGPKTVLLLRAGTIT